MIQNDSVLRVFSPRVEAVLSVLGCIGALCFLVLFGIIGFLKDGSLGFDFVVFHDAGVQFLQGVNPWLASIDSGAPFSYPPHLGTFVAFYGVFPFKVGLIIHTGINLISIASVAYLANQWFLKITDLRQMSLAQGIGLAFVLANPFVAHSVYEGQWSLPAVALLFWSWHFLQNNRWVAAGILLGIATIKPQVSLLYIFWLLFQLNFRVLTVGACVAFVMLVPAVINFGLIETFSAWFASMEYYATQWANIPGSPHVVGLEGVLVSVGVNGAGPFFKALSLVALLLLFLYRKYFSEILLVNFFLVLALTFIYGHDTDFVTLSALWSYFVILAFRTKQYVAVGIAFVLLLGMFFPQRFIRVFDIPILFHTRTFILPLICWVAWQWEKQERQNRIEERLSS